MNIYIGLQICFGIAFKLLRVVNTKLISRIIIKLLKFYNLDHHSKNNSYKFVFLSKYLVENLKAFIL